MQGRIENDIKKAEKIKRILVGKPAYMEDYLISMSGKTMGSKLAYMRYVLNFLDWISEQINIQKAENFKGVRPSMISRYLEYIGEGKKSSIKAARYYAISNFFKFLYFEGYIDTNPCDRIPAPKIKDEAELVYMNKKEVRMVEKKIATLGNGKWGKRDMAIFTLGVTTGLRVTAISEINIEDIDFERRVIKVVEKGNVNREVGIGNKVAEILEDWIFERNQIIGTETGALFISNRKQRMGVSTIQKMLTKYTNGLDKHISPHKMRSTFATNLYSAKRDVYAVAKALGHKNVQVTARYAEVVEEQKKEIADIMDQLL